MRFGVDIDGVFAQFIPEVVTITNRLWPSKNVPLDYQPDNWDFPDILTKDEWKQVWLEIRKTHGFWRNATPYRKNIEALQLFTNKHKDADVYFITSRADTIGESVLAQTFKWLNWFDLAPRSGHSTIIPVADATHKAAVLRALQLPFFLDDYAVTVYQLQNISDLKTFVLDQPWNRHATDLPRVFSVAEYLKIVEKNG
jgi:deoxypyrimidine-specific 5' nucleotidase type C protein (NT5C)